MIPDMDRVGVATRRLFCGVPQTQPFYLVINNTGGYGTDDAIVVYEILLSEEYYMILIFQVPWSPFTNVPDVGVWCALG